MNILPPDAQISLEEALSQKGQRLTRQREVVYSAIVENYDHPTAEEVYDLCKKAMDGISLATVYNCLETLVACGLVKELNLGRPPVRYEPNRGEHAHFYCEESGKVIDIPLTETFKEELSKLLPEGSNLTKFQLRLEGTTTV